MHPQPVTGLPPAHINPAPPATALTLAQPNNSPQDGIEDSNRARKEKHAEGELWQA
jgi:hypothetical protein